MINISKGELSDPLGDIKNRGLTVVTLLGDPLELHFVILKIFNFKQGN